MKAIIEGKRYDTETATELARWDSGHNPGDFHRLEETLYKTPKGSYFLHGEGGAFTQYSQPVGDNGSAGGERIVPLSESEAIDWLARHGKVDVLETDFSDHIDDA